MKLTNNYGLPDLFMKALQRDTHRKTGDISVTELWNPPQLVLYKDHPNVVEDVVDRIWMLLGTATHFVIEQALQGEERYLTEHHMRVEIEIDGKIYSISGTMDIYDHDLFKIQDFKITSSWNYVFATDKVNWIAQLNTYAFMARAEGKEVREAEIIAIYRDWTKSNTYNNKDYPRHQAGTIPIQLYDNEAIRARITQQLARHIAVRNGETIECTPEDKWEKATTYAVKREGKSRAIRVLPSQQKAEEYIEDNRVTGGYIEKRPGERTRCQHYCPARSVCPQKAREDMGK